MPRQARIDAPGGLPYLVIRGIERREIFEDHKDREDFLEWLVRHQLDWAEGRSYEVLVSGRVKMDQNMPGHMLTLAHRPIFRHAKEPFWPAKNPSIGN
jgi:hypothetical protein